MKKAVPTLFALGLLAVAWLPVTTASNPSPHRTRSGLRPACQKVKIHQADWSERFREATAGTADAQPFLSDLRDFIHTHPGAESIPLLQKLLASGFDGATGQPWAWDESAGTPLSTTGLRATLLIWLSDCDTGAAMPFAAAIWRSEQATPEDWAIAFHCTLRDNSGGQHTTLLREQGVQLLQREDWLQQPTPGFLQALEMLAAFGGREEFINLTELCGLGLAEGLELAAESAAARLLEAHPHAALAVLAEDPSVLARAPLVRARLVAAAQADDPAQRQWVVRYWNRTDLSAEERLAFTAGFGGEPSL